MNSYFLALQEMKDNFNDKYIVILDRKNADFLYKGFVSVEKYDYEAVSYTHLTLPTM